MYYSVIVSDNKVTKSISSKFISHFNSDITSKVVPTVDDLMKLLNNNELIDVLVIEETETLKFDSVMNVITRSNVELPLILMSEECNPKLMSRAINEHVNNYLYIKDRDPSDYYQELTNLIVFTVERCRIQNQHALETKRFASLVELAKKNQFNFQEVIEYSLNKAIELTDSTIGYVAMVNEPENKLTMLAWSESSKEMCKVKEMTMDYKLSEAGLWAAPVRTGKAVYINDYGTSQHSMKHGLPGGHIKLNSLLMVPIKLGGTIIGNVGVGNKLREYTSADEYNVQQLFQEAFLIEQSIITKNRYERDMSIFRHIFDSGPFGLIYLSKDGKYGLFNSVAASLVNVSEKGIIDISNLKGELITYLKERIFNYTEEEDGRIFELNDCKWTVSITPYKEEGLRGYSIILKDVTKILEYQVKIDSGEAILKMMRGVIVNELKYVQYLLAEPAKVEGNVQLATEKIADISRFAETFNTVNFNDKSWQDLGEIIKKGFSMYEAKDVDDIIRSGDIQLYVNDDFYKVFYEYKRLICIRCIHLTFIDVRYRIEKGILKITLNNDGLHLLTFSNNVSGPVYCDPLPTMMMKQLCTGGGMDIKWVPRNHGFNAEIHIPADLYRIG